MASMGCPWVSDGWMDLVEEEGWRGAFFYAVIEGAEDGSRPTRDEVRYLRSEYGMEHDLLYDPEGLVYASCRDSELPGLPFFFVVNPDDMLVWLSSHTWFDDVGWQARFLVTVCEEGAANDPGYLP
jgi:hypothetical protein